MIKFVQKSLGASKRNDCCDIEILEIADEKDLSIKEKGTNQASRKRIKTESKK